jgi:hypothetical protein
MVTAPIVWLVYVMVLASELKVPLMVTDDPNPPGFVHITFVAPVEDESNLRFTL